MQTQERIVQPLDQHQQNTQSSKDKTKERDYVGFFDLYRFAQRSDYILIFFGIVFSGVLGCGLPFFAYIWGKMTDVFVIGGNTLVDKAIQNRNIFLYIGAGAFVAGWISFACWIIVGERMAIRCRKAYLSSLLKQQIGYFDVTSQYTLSSQFSNDTLTYQRAIGEKVGSLVMIFAMFVCGIAIAFAIRWLLTIIIFGALPFLGITGFLFIYLIELKNTKFLQFYQKSGSRAQQVITAIKTVKQLNGQEYQFNLYKVSMQYISQKVFKYALYAGIGSGLFFLAQFCAYALGFWYGSHCAQGSNVCSDSVTGSRYTAGQIMIVFFAIFVGSYNFMQLVPSLQKIYSGMKAAYRLYKVIDRESLIQNNSGRKIQNFKGIIKFENVHFSYPKDKNAKILKGLTVTLNATEELSKQITYEQNQNNDNGAFCCGGPGVISKVFNKKQIKSNSNAFVGQSGCGKSTVLQLIMRFYDPDQGRITLDGVDLKQLDLRWLRTQIGYVGQEPVLFNTTIKQNIRYGKPDATDEQIRQALIKAQALDFVQALQQKLETNVGYGGGHLSGGQKQRIAIARAIIKDPKILILDQATSALDRKNQKLIQGTLDKVAQGRTSITVAHRVKTIMNCNKIFVLSKGKLLESGSFNELQRFKQYKDLKEDQQAAQKSQQKQLKKLEKIQKKKTILDQDDQDDLQNDLCGFSKQALIQKQEERIRKKYSKGIYKRLFSYTSGNRFKFFLGVISSGIGGAAYPVFTIFMAKLVIAIYQLSVSATTLNTDAARTDANRNSLIITLIGVVAFFANLFEMLFFSLVGQKVTQKIRLQSYHKVLRMPIPWFDLPRNAGSAVASRLAVDTQLVNGLTTLLFAIIVKNLTTIIASFIIAFIYEWRIGLVGLVCMPLMLLAGFISMLFYGGFGDMSQKVYSSSAALISESIMNMKTVQAFLYQDIICERYGSMLDQPIKFAVKKGNIVGILYGLSQFFIFFSFAMLFWFGSLILRDNGNTIQNVTEVFIAIFAIVWSGWTAGNNFFFLPDVGAGQRGAARLFQLNDHKDQDQCQMMHSSKFLKSGFSGNIVLNDVAFRYNSRNQYVFKNISISIKQGQKIAFVGPSGCGKSTIIQLLLRFYMQNKGTITLDGQDIKDYDLNYLRSCFGVVGQEPVLFNGTFRQNIKYNNENASDHDIAKAAQKAKALTFITGQQNLEEELKFKQCNSEQSCTQSQKQRQNTLKQGKGFEKNVGMRGSHISGGQKQRVAIARAILKQPKLLLLDEATSALDSKNQKLVQDSLDHIMIGKTTITIAHRIDTIKNSDRIFVFDKGEIVQSGTYKQLINKKGYFYRLERGINFV